MIGTEFTILKHDSPIVHYTFIRSGMIKVDDKVKTLISSEKCDDSLHPQHHVFTPDLSKISTFLSAMCKFAFICNKW